MTNVLKQFIVYVFISLLYGTITLLFFRNIIFTPGHFAGGDWTLADSQIQINRLYENMSLTWGEIAGTFGNRQSAQNNVPYILLIKMLSTFGLTEVYSKLILVGVYIIAGLSMYSFTKFLKIKKFIAFFSGLLYITAPIFFNYSVMGWIYVLFSLALLPLASLFFIKAVQKNSISFAVLSGLIYSLSVIQSQSLVWYMMAFIALSIYLTRDKVSLISYLKVLSINVIIVFLLHFYWMLGLILVPDIGISGSDIVKSPVSLGMLGLLDPTLFIRLYGSLYNYQYETVVKNAGLDAFSFVVPLLSFGCLILKKRSRLVLSFLVIALIPFFIYILNLKREILVYIPFSNVIRDFLRFSVLSTFAYAVMGGLFLNHIFNEKINRLTKFIFFTTIFCVWIVSIYPWWNGEISNWKPNQGCQFKLRTKIFPKEYKTLEQSLSIKYLDQKALFLPIGPRYLNDDIRFQETCQRLVDTYAAYGPLPGYLNFSDRGLDQFQDLGGLIVDKYYDKDLAETLRLTTIRYFIVLKNGLDEKTNAIYPYLKDPKRAQTFKPLTDNKILAVYENTQFIPHFYVPRTFIMTDRLTKNFTSLIKKIDNSTLPIILFKSQNKNKTYLLKQNFINNSKNEIGPIIEFKKITPSKYRLIVHQAKNMFYLTFNELYHHAWKVYVVPSNKITLQKKIQYSNHDLDSAKKNEIIEYMKNGWISSIGEKEDVEFISKKFGNTIQNNNLPDGSLWETWNIKPLDSSFHLKANGYANAWIINTSDICKNSLLCTRHNNTYDIELVVEFLPQKYFYIGSIVSIISLIVCFLYLITRMLKGIKSKKNNGK